jgi:heptosyltransferase-2
MLGLGDAVYYLPFVQALRARYPQAEIVVVVVSDAARVVLECGGGCAEIIVFDRGGEQRGCWPLLRLLWNLRRRKFDVVISGAHPNSVRVPLFSFLAGGTVRVGARSERLRFLYNHHVDVEANSHYSDRYRMLLAAVDVHISSSGYQPTLKPPPESKEAAKRLWEEAGVERGRAVVGIASGADVNVRGQWQPYLKRWNNQGYAEVARWATEELGAQVVMFGARAEATLAAEISKLSGVPVVNLCGKTKLREIQWLISECTVFVSNDTGLMHLAGALGTPVVALFGPTNPNSFRPPGHRQRVVEGRAPCAPCYPHPVCDLTACEAMNGISAPQVIDNISDLMDSRQITATSWD